MTGREAPTDSGARAHLWRVSIVAVSGSFLTQMDGSIVNVSLSSLARAMGSDIAAVHWVTSGYLLALAIALPLSGWLVDNYGSRRVYIQSFAAFTIASGLCAVAWSVPSLIVFRIFQGISGGLLAPMTQMMMARAAGDRLSHVMGYAAMPVLLAPLLGPVLAGLLLQQYSWRALFLVNLPLGALALILAVVLLPDDSDTRRAVRLDLPGLVLLSSGLLLFLYGVDAFETPIGLSALVLAPILLAGFARHSLRHPEIALIDLRLFRKRSFSTSVMIQFLSNGTSFAGQMLIPIYLVRACGFSASQAGLLLAPLGLGMLCAYPFLGRLTDTFGIRFIAAAGALLSALATIPLIVMGVREFDQEVLIIALLARGVGMSMIGVPTVSTAYSSIPSEAVPMASTTLNVFQRLGGPTLTTGCMIFFEWMTSIGVRAAQPSTALVLAATFALLMALQLVLLILAFQLPLRSRGAAAEGES